eukprot:gene7259-8068_t
MSHQKQKDIFPSNDRHKELPLWVFILELLGLDNNDATCVRWTFRRPYEFKITKPEKLAALWGSIRKSPTSYANLRRGIRYYYRKDIIEKVVNIPFTYRFTKSPKTEPYLVRCFPNNFRFNCPFMKEPNYIKIKEYVGENNSCHVSETRATTTAITKSCEETEAPESMETGGSFSPTASPDGSNCSRSSGSSTVDIFSAHASVSSDTSINDTSHSELSLSLQAYKLNIETKIYELGNSEVCEPPDWNMFWMVNPRYA